MKVAVVGAGFIGAEVAASVRQLGLNVTMIEADPRWPGFLFNTTCLIGPGGILYKYRKVNPWIPYEVHASPHDTCPNAMTSGPTPRGSTNRRTHTRPAP